MSKMPKVPKIPESLRSVFLSKIAKERQINNIEYLIFV